MTECYAAPSASDASGDDSGTREGARR
ncbi:MAG: hypothetical protein RLZZ288_1171, partial [Planctomycetota bacterium]